jgi:hypothetical protein
MGLNTKNVLVPASIIICCLCSCHKSDITRTSTNNFIEDTTLAFLNYGVIGISNQVTINYPNILVQFPDSVIDPGNLVASFTLPTNDLVSIAGVSQVSGFTANNFDDAFIYTVKNQDNDSSQWEVAGTNNNYTLSWGLGQWLQLSRSNNKDYNWYIDQGSTGTCALSNCGPSCVTMAMMWSDSTYTKPAAAARNYFNDSCQGWQEPNVTIYLSTDSVPYAFVPLGDSAAQMRDLFKAQLDSGRIIIIYLQMGSIPFPTTPGRVGQFQPGAGDHLIILKGYRQTELGFFFEVYDPWDLGLNYPDGGPMGENRFYRYDNVYIGIISDGGGPQLAISQRW